VVDAQKLMRIAAKAGVGESARVLKRHRSWFLRLAFPGAYSPSRLIGGVLPYMVDSRNGIASFHLYTFDHNNVGGRRTG
jgi:methylenetetrahydrofolate reductase (NADPH)